MQLRDYGMSRERGFLSPFEIDEVFLPTRFDAILDAADSLSGLITSGQVRHWLDALPDPEIECWARTAEEDKIRAAMVRYSFLVQTYVWGEAEPPAALPANLARPMVALAERLGQAPLLPYSGYVLDNWARIDKAGPVALGNIRMVQNFAGGEDENWFVLVHVGIEAEAGVLLDNAVRLVTASSANSEAECERLLVEMNEVWERIYAIFRRMPERCDPYI